MIYKTNSGYGVNFNQLIQNGNFESSSGWTTLRGNFTVSNNEAKVIANTASSFFFYRTNNSTTNSSHKYFLSVKIRSSFALSGCKFTTYNGSFSGSFDIEAGEKIYSLISSPSTNRNDDHFGIQFPSFLNDYLYVSNFNISDLTQDFGSGNEPTTVAEFREMYPDDYYDYTLSQWQWAKKGKITSYPTPVIENGTTLLPIEHHIVGLAKNGIGRIEIEGNSYQNGTPTPTSPIPIQSFNGSGDTVKLVGAGGKELQLPNSITLNNQTISLELNKVGTYADKLIIDKASGKVELVRNVKEVLVDKNTTKYTYNYPNADSKGFEVLNVLDGSYTRQIGLCEYEHVGGTGSYPEVWVGVAGDDVYYVKFYTAVGATNTSEFNAWLGDRVIKTIYGSNYPTTTDITNATYQINGITHNVSDWLNFVDREIEIETDGLAQSNLSVDYEPTLIYNYKKPELSDISLLKLKTGSYKNTNNQGPYVEVKEGNEIVINTPSTNATYGVTYLPILSEITLKAGHTYYYFLYGQRKSGDWNAITIDYTGGGGPVSYFLYTGNVNTITLETDKVISSVRAFLNNTSTHYDNYSVKLIITENRQYLIDKGIISQ